MDFDGLKKQYDSYRSLGLSLDMTRGKPSSAQLDLSNELLTLPGQGKFHAVDGTDCRNYGGLSGIPEVRDLFARILGVPATQILIGGNSSLTLMHEMLVQSYVWGTAHGPRPWKDESRLRFLCPAPGYDRHFAITEHLGFELVPVDMTSTGPDMDMVEGIVESDPSVKGIWCVPKYSNPTGITYSEETVERLASMPTAAADFRIMWDNAYAEHHLGEKPDKLANLFDACVASDHSDRVLMFASTSKVSFAGSGVSALAASDANIAHATHHLSFRTIGPDKINQLRHARMFPDINTLRVHMSRHSAILKPKFDLVQEVLRKELGSVSGVSFSRPNGGYFISVDLPEGCAREVVARAADIGVKFTKAGATFPYGIDPRDSNIRLAPSFPELDDIRTAMNVLCTTIKLVIAEKHPQS